MKKYSPYYLLFQVRLKRIKVVLPFPKMQSFGRSYIKISEDFHLCLHYLLRLSLTVRQYIDYDSQKIQKNLQPKDFSRKSLFTAVDDNDAETNCHWSSSDSKSLYNSPHHCATDCPGCSSLEFL